MQRYFIELSFRGTSYHGWQAQPNALSVQSEVERTLNTLLHGPVKITGAGRTDTGVHARKYTAHFDTNHDLPSHRADFIYKTNAILPQDIAVKDVYPVNADAHARYSALSRTYKYFISRVKDPFHLDDSWFNPVALDLNLLNQAAAEIMKFHDFKSFAKVDSDVKSHECTIFDASWTLEDERYIFTITANRFLRNMVRAIVGTLIDIGRGKTTVDHLHRIVEGRDRCLAGFSVPAKGLILYDIVYPEQIVNRV